MSAPDIEIDDEASDLIAHATDAFIASRSGRWQSFWRKRSKHYRAHVDKTLQADAYAYISELTGIEPAVISAVVARWKEEAYAMMTGDVLEPLPEPMTPEQSWLSMQQK
jgi:hypothetical protein